MASNGDDDDQFEDAVEAIEGGAKDTVASSAAAAGSTVASIPEGEGESNSQDQEHGGNSTIGTNHHIDRYNDNEDDEEADDGDDSNDGDLESSKENDRKAIPEAADAKEDDDDEDVFVNAGSTFLPEDVAEWRIEFLDVDIDDTRRGLDLFLNSRFKEAEALCLKLCNKSLYHALGLGTIMFFKALMTFDREDVDNALKSISACVHLAASRRKKESSIIRSITGFVKTAGALSGVASVRLMTRYERHVELVFAESYLLKAMLCLVTSQDGLLAFVREGMHIRQSYAIYKSLDRFINKYDKFGRSTRSSSPVSKGNASATTSSSSSSSSSSSPPTAAAPIASAQPALSSPAPSTAEVSTPSSTARMRTSSSGGGFFRSFAITRSGSMTGGSSASTSSSSSSSAVAAQESAQQADDADDDDGGGAVPDLAETINDAHFQSGVAFGIGTFNLLLSLLPSKVLKIFEIIGFSGERAAGLSRLEAGIETLGLRETFCTLQLLGYHTILASYFPVPDQDVAKAEELLKVYIQKYPKGAIVRFLNGRRFQCQGKWKQAIDEYELSVQGQDEWRQLHHICFWEMSISNSCLLRFDEMAKYAWVLREESNWSKAFYTYQLAVSAYMLLHHGSYSGLSQLQSSTDPRLGAFRSTLTEKDVSELFASVPKLTRKIAGKSIPLEKFVSRKSRKFLMQEGRLFLPGLELLAVWGSFEWMGERLEAALECIDCELAKLRAAVTRVRKATDLDTEKNHHHDDMALALYLKGLATFYLPGNNQLQNAEPVFKELFSIEKRLTLDHYIIPYARYEYAMMLLKNDRAQDAKKEIILVKSSYKGYSLENALQIKLHNITNLIELKLSEPQAKR